MKKELNINNSKKLIMGVSILFCTVILFIGVTTAFFTQSGKGDTGNLITVDINGSIGYDDSNNPYMRQGLIPAKEEIAIQAFNLDGVNKCKDEKGFSACSIYEFTITNNSDVTQELMIDMAPSINTFGNLTYILYEVNGGVSEKRTESLKLDTITNEMILNNEYKTYNLIKYLMLEPEEFKTYQLLFYINDTGEDQTLIDAGKNFGSAIKVSSVATGTYFLEEFGDECWTTTRLGDNTYKLDSFIGFEGDNLKEVCKVYYDDSDNDSLYIVNVPSRIGEKRISTLDDWLFVPVDIQFNPNKNWQVKEYNVSEGITTIEDGNIVNAGSYGEHGVGTFFATGYNVFGKTPTITEGVVINLPSTLKYLGDYAFNSGNIKSVNLPEGLEFIGNRAFGNMMKEISFEIPSTVHTIDEYAFAFQRNIKNITFNLDENGKSDLKIIGNNAFREISLQSIEIPASVTSIGSNAFWNNSNLIKLTFGEGSKLTSIGDSAFYGCDLTYTDPKNPLVIPSSVTSIGSDTFAFNGNLKYIRFNGTLLEGNPTDWYSNITLNPPIED